MKEESTVKEAPSETEQLKECFTPAGFRKSVLGDRLVQEMRIAQVKRSSISDQGDIGNKELQVYDDVPVETGKRDIWRYFGLLLSEP